MMLRLFLFFCFFCTNNCHAATVGDAFGGGTVFCVCNTTNTTQCVTTGQGTCGLIMANEDQVNFDSNPGHGVTWSSEDKETGAVSDDGVANTAAIIAAHPGDNPSNNAAWLCRNYRDPEGHTDWYLPSKNELNKKMYLYAKANNLIGTNCTGSKVGGTQCLVGGLYDTSNYYWSSSESSDGLYAWGLRFDIGLGCDLGKSYLCLGTRAVRAFNNLGSSKLSSVASTSSSALPVILDISTVFTDENTATITINGTNLIGISGDGIKVELVAADGTVIPVTLTQMSSDQIILVVSYAGLENLIREKDFYVGVTYPNGGSITHELIRRVASQSSWLMPTLAMPVVLYYVFR